MAYIIKSYHTPHGGSLQRIHFWQTPWLQFHNDAWHEIGGWMTYSGHATKYESADEAEKVNLFRGLNGRIDVARLTDQP